MVLIIETVEAIENLEEIAAVPGIDVLFLGPWDMCLSLGLDPLLLPHREIGQILEKCLKLQLGLKWLLEQEHLDQRMWKQGLIKR